MLIGCRYHSLVLALKFGIPVIAISWSHKYRELLKEFNLERFCLEADELDGNKLNLMVQEIMDDYENLSIQIKNRIYEINKEVNTNLSNVLSWVEK